MNKKVILAALVGLLVGGLIVGVTASQAVNGNNTTVMRTMGMDMSKLTANQKMKTGMSMDDMAKMLDGKTGDEFDKAFISMMIDHHQGAIEMAELAAANAGHPEIKKLSEDIIAAQTTEIAQMKMWQQAWGYSTSSDPHAGH